MCSLSPEGSTQGAREQGLNGASKLTEIQELGGTAMVVQVTGDVQWCTAI